MRDGPDPLTELATYRARVVATIVNDERVVVWRALKDFEESRSITSF